MRKPSPVYCSVPITIPATPVTATRPSSECPVCSKTSSTLQSRTRSTHAPSAATAAAATPTNSGCHRMP